MTLAYSPFSGAYPAEAESFAYVTNDGSNSVSVIDTANNRVVATIPVGKNPVAVAVSPDGKHAYVANLESNTVSVIDVASNKVIATVPVGPFPEGIAVTPDGKRVFVTNNGTNSVSVIDTATNTVGTPVLVGSAPFAVAFTPDGKHAYVTGFGNVSVIDTGMNVVVATVPVGDSPEAVAITPDGRRAYVTNTGVSGGVSVIDTTTNTVVATVPVGAAPDGVGITPDGKHAYVASGNPCGPGIVSVIDTATNTVTATVAVTGCPTRVATTPDGKLAYVTNLGANTVSAIDTATNTVVATVRVGTSPVGAAIIGAPPPCGPGDATLANIKFPAAGTMTFDVSSPARTLQSITLPGATNIVAYTLPKVASGGHSATGGVFTKADSRTTATFELQGVFVDPAFACLIDPTTTTLRINTGHKAIQAFQMIPDSEHFVEIGNGTPGLRWLRIEVNGKYNRTLSLASGETARADLSRAMTQGQNTLTFTGEGKTGSFTNIYVSDSAPGKLTLAGTREAGIWGHLMFEKEAP